VQNEQTSVQMNTDSRDRTEEFRNLVAKIAAAQSDSVPVDEEPLLPSPAVDLSHKSQFTRAAQHISRGIFGVSEKLERLTLLAKKKSLFDDVSPEINKLTATIKTDIGALNGEIDRLHRWVDDNLQRGSRQSSLNSNAIVQNLQLELATATKSFTEILQMRTQALKDQNLRRKEFEGGGAASSLRQRHAPAASISGRMLGEEEIASLHSEDAPVGDSQTDLEQGQLMEQRVLQDEYLTQRAQAVENIEKTIVELGQMYQRLASIVSLQEEVTLRIDENMDVALHHVKEGEAELSKYLTSISSSRWLIIKVFFVLIAFVIFFMVFVA